MICQDCQISNTILPYKMKKKKDQSIKDYIRTIRCENIKCNGLIFSIQFIKREIVYMKGCEWMYLIVEAKKFSN